MPHLKCDHQSSTTSIGPEILTEGTLTNEPSTEIPTVTQNLYTQGKISEEVVGVFFAPTTTDVSTNGELTFGGVDSTKYTGTLTYTSVFSFLFFTHLSELFQSPDHNLPCRILLGHQREHHLWEQDDFGRDCWYR